MRTQGPPLTQGLLERELVPLGPAVILGLFSPAGPRNVRLPLAARERFLYGTLRGRKAPGGGTSR
jgi:hypothetical protein